MTGDSHCGGWGVEKPSPAGAARSTYLAAMLLKFSSASWTRPRYFRHRPFSSLTRQSSSAEYSFSEKEGVGEKGGLLTSATGAQGAPLEPGTQVI